MSNALTIYGQFDQLQRAAVALYKSGYFNDAKSEAQAVVKVMAGAELGLPPFASMTGIHIIQGKPVLGSNTIATLVKNDPRYDYRIAMDTDPDQVCALEWYENGQCMGHSSFSMEEARRAGLTGKDNWKKYPSDMLFARAISRGARRFAPGIFGGAPVYTPDEMGADVDEDGNVLEGEVVTITTSNGKPEGNGDAPGTSDVELVIYETPQAEYLNACAAMLDLDVDTVKAGFKAIGVKAVSKDAMQRVRDYRALCEHQLAAAANGDPQQGALLDTSKGAYEEA